MDDKQDETKWTSGPPHNAALIASAPDLYAALEDAVGLLRAIAAAAQGCGDWRAAALAEVETSLEALAKARGER